MALRICAAPKPDLKTLFRSANLWTLSENSTSLLITSEPNPTFRVQRPYSSKKGADIPKNKLQGLITADAQPTNGVCYDKKPFRMLLEAGEWLRGREGKLQGLFEGRQEIFLVFVRKKPQSAHVRRNPQEQAAEN